MTRKKTDKKLFNLESKFHDILICKKNDCRPFLEVLIEEPENISRQNLGILVGIFQIDDRSEDSSYVVNYLISIIKKEYFSRSNRGPVENFEASLHKANLALAKLATHENIGWIGKINAVCAVIEKNNLLLSQTGNASAFLLRNTTLTEITEIQDENIDVSPLKTFQDVISGKIEKDDKLIFTTKEIFDIFSLEEIKKSALKFSQENFVQFLNTALINELDQVATLIIDVAEKVEEVAEISPVKKIEEVNVFSQAAFQKELSPKMQEKEKIKEAALEKERQEIVQELNEEPRDFVDKKTGHIYIKEPQNFPANNSFKKPEIDFSVLKIKFSTLAILSARALSGTKNKIKGLFLSLWQKSSLKISRIQFGKKPTPIEELKTENKTAKTVEIKTPKIEKLKMAYSKLEIKTKTLLLLRKLEKSATWTKDKATDGLVLVLRKPTSLTIRLIAFSKSKWRNYKNRERKTPESNSKQYPWENITSSPMTQKIEPKKTISALLQKASELEKIIKLKKILPDLSRLKQIIKNLDRKQKISALIILAFLLVAPYWIVKWEDKKTENKAEIIEEIPKIAMPLEKDLNVVRIEKLDEVYAGSVTKILNLNNKFFALKDTEIVDLENNNSFTIASDFQNPELFLEMEDLNLLFLIKNNRVISLSPTTKKFQNNNLAFPENSKIVSAKTYLTYIYLLDAKNSQIYRAPRADGGFGEKTAWIKDNLDLSNAKDLAINENIFVINDQSILKLFQGKKQNFSLENTETVIMPDRLYAKNTGTTFYILDKTNSRIIKLDNDGKILAQYHNVEIVNANDFAVNEESNLVYISNKDGVKSFRIN